MKYLYFFLLASILSYAAEWTPYYVSLFSPSDIQVTGSISKYAFPCTEPNINGRECKVEYRLPNSFFSLAPGRESVGFGVLLHATEIGCTENFRPISSYGEVSSAGKTLDFLYIYQTASLKTLNCRTGITIRAWSPSQYRRFGLIDGKSVVGTADAVDRVKKIVQFFRAEFLELLLGVFLGVFLFNLILVRLMSITIKKTPLEVYSTYWLAFMFIFSGAANAILPVISESFIFTRLSNYVTLIAHFAPALYTLSKSNNKLISIFTSTLIKKRLIKMFSLFHIVATFYVLSPYFARGLAPCFLYFSSFFLACGIITRNSFLIFFSLAAIIDSLKLFMIANMPTAYVTMMYAMFCMISSFIFRVKSAADLVSLMEWVREKTSLSSTDSTYIETLKQFGDRMGIGRITVLTMKGNHQFTSTTIMKSHLGWETEINLLEKLPPVFSHVLSTREPLLHLEEDSLYSENIRKGEVRKFKYDSSHFTVLPILRDSIPIGGIAFTSYKRQMATEEFERLKLNSVIQTLLPYLGNALVHRAALESVDWHKQVNAVVDELGSLKTQTDNSDLAKKFDSMAEIIARNLKVGTILATINPISRLIEVRSISGHIPSVEALYKDIQLYAVSHNEQGPIPLAINRKKVVSIGDIKWIEGVIHPLTQEIFNKAKTSSCSAVPLFADSQDSEEPWGVLWLESPILGLFTANTEAGLTAISQAIEAIFNHERLIHVQKRTQQALAGFLPDGILEKFIDGKSVREEEEGFLLMADLRDSTKISRKIGAERWSQFVLSLVPSVKVVCSRYGWCLQSVVWDAFYFTLKSDSKILNETSLHDMASELNRVFYSSIQLNDWNLDPRKNHHWAARFCVVYGDTTRDIRSAMTSNWSIVGQAMAKVAKLEQACKGLNGWLFSSSSQLPEDSLYNWSEVCFSDPLGENICKFELEPNNIDETKNIALTKEPAKKRVA